jgi:hypothetical protein
LKSIILALAALWLVLFAASFVVLQVGDESAGATNRLARVAAFLTWQALAFGAASSGAFTTRYAVTRGVERVKLIGYAPLALSVFLVASFIALIAFQFYVVPVFE